MQLTDKQFEFVQKSLSLINKDNESIINDIVRLDRKYDECEYSVDFDAMDNFIKTGQYQSEYVLEAYEFYVKQYGLPNEIVNILFKNYIHEEIAEKLYDIVYDAIKTGQYISAYIKQHRPYLFDWYNEK